MATTASTPLKSTTPPQPSPWQATSLQRCAPPPQPPQWASNVCPLACRSPTSTRHWAQALTACTTTANDSCWAWAAAPSSCASASSSAARSATPAPSWTRSATAALAATASRTATCSSTRTARPRPRPPHITPSRLHRTRTSHDHCRSACRRTSDLED